MKEPETVGVPSITPLVLKLSPNGRDPELRRKPRLGPAGEVALIRAEYGEFSSPSGSEVAVMTGTGGATVIENGALADVAIKSNVRIVNWKVPAWVGVPENTPTELRINPGGKEPTIRVNKYGGVPPEAEIAAL